VQLNEFRQSTPAVIHFQSSLYSSNLITFGHTAQNTHNTTNTMVPATTLHVSIQTAHENYKTKPSFSFFPIKIFRAKLINLFN